MWRSLITAAAGSSITRRFSAGCRRPAPPGSRARRHPLYTEVIGIPVDEITTQGPAAPGVCGDPAPNANPPLQKPYAMPNATPRCSPTPSNGSAPKRTCLQQYALDIASCKNAVATVGGMGTAAGILCYLGAAETEGSSCIPLVAGITTTGAILTLAQCTIAAQAKEKRCVQSESQP
jgi:hypothetical protein